MVKVIETVSGAEAGAFLHLRHPVTGEGLYEGDEKAGIWLRGIDSDQYKAAQRTARRMASKDIDGSAADARGHLLLSALVIKFEHLEGEDGLPLKPTAKDCKWFFEQSSNYVLQVQNFVQDGANFFEPASGD